ncbi:MAG: hypothetical protein ABI091_25840 [Ferruginibacter sp.]
MKKLMIAAILLMGFGIGASAQKTAPAAAPTAKPMHVVKKTTTTTATKVVPMTKATTAPKAAVVAKTTTSTSTKMKANGTPDMRYKANKMKAAPVVAGPTKKDGTADMRYKANKVKH